MIITNQTKCKILADKAELADTFFSRMKGLLGRAHLNSGEALIITHCNSIHMFFMRFAIDAVFVSKDGKVVGCLQNIQPNRLSPIFFKSSYVLELTAGTIKSSGTVLGDLVVIAPPL